MRVRACLPTDNPPSRAVARLLRKANRLLAPDEGVLGLVVQQRSLRCLWPGGAVLTSRQIVLFRPVLLGLGLRLQQFGWAEVQDLYLRENRLGACLVVVAARLTGCLGRLPKARALHFGQLAQARQAEAQVEAEAQAQAPALAHGGPVPKAASPANDPLKKLEQVQAMLDYKLINRAEYEERRRAILVMPCGQPGNG